MSDIGNQLRTVRESKGLTIADVEKVTCIRARFLEAIEDGRWDDLPGPVQIRGFLKNYAAFLGLDGDDLVAARERKVTRQIVTTSAPPATPPRQMPIPPEPVNVPQEMAGEPELSDLVSLPETIQPLQPLELVDQPQEELMDLVEPLVDLEEESDILEPPAPVLGPVAPLVTEAEQEQAPVRANAPQPPTSSQAQQFNLPAWLSLDIMAGGVAIVLFVVVAFLAARTYLFPLVTELAATPEATEVAATQVQTAITPTRTITPTAVFPANPDGAIEVGLASLEHAWVRVTTDGVTAFEGLFTPGQSLKWDAREQLIVETGNGAAFNFAINGKTMGALGARDKITIRAWSPRGEVVPPPTPTPLPPTPTPEPVPTLVPLPTP